MPRILDASQEVDGSRFLQMRLAKGTADTSEIDKIYDAVLSSTVMLSSDLHASSVMLKLFERVTQEQAKAMAIKLKGDIFNLSTHRYGCRIVQKVIEVLPESLQVELTSELVGRVIECVEDMHGNHVMQMCVKQMLPSRVNFILDALLKSVHRMSQHMYGCRVLQRLLERCTTQQLEPLLDRIMSNVAKLAKDKHGNYVVQCILEKGRLDDKRRVIEVVRDCFIDFAKDKVSSNVVERCFEVCAVGVDSEKLSEDREILYRIVLGDSGDAAAAPLQQLMHDRFGNYIVQCVIKHSRGADREALQARIAAAEPQLCDSATGRHVIAAMQRATGQTPDESKEEQAPGAPSKGSVLHALGQCKPCAWFWKPDGCRNDQNCKHCHLCPEGELKERKKARRMSRREDQVPEAKSANLEAKDGAASATVEAKDEAASADGEAKDGEASADAEAKAGAASAHVGS